jgi:hypothetical protein
MRMKSQNLEGPEAFPDLYLIGPSHTQNARHVMSQPFQAPETEHACPVGFIVVPTFVGALLWLLVMLNRLPH